ncbi:MAG: hypothetical protein J6Y80_00420, partial [Victivallales bacterium]|nr:hypothetical protein [Victivallales bacterium]
MMHKILCIILLCILSGAAIAPSAAAADYEAAATPEELYTYIQELYSRKFDETLLPQAERFLQQYPQHAYSDTVRQIRIAVLNRLGRHRETADAIDDYLQQTPYSTQRGPFLKLAGACRFQLKEFERAAECYRNLADAAENAPAREEALLALASCQQYLRNLAEERKLLKNLADLPLQDGFDARRDARLRFAPILQNEGDYQAALRIYQELLDFQGTPAKLRPALLYNAATLAFQLGADFTLPERLYATLLVEAPKDQLATQALRQLCFCKFHLRKYAEFLELAEKYRSQAHSPEHDQQLDLDTVEALVALQRHAEALPWLEKLLGSQNASPEVIRRARYYELLALLETQQDAQALDRGDSYLEDYPNSIYKPYVLARMADAALRVKALPRARTYLEVLLPLLAANREAARQYGLQLARIYENEQLWLNATELLEKLASETPDSTQLLLDAAETAARIPDFERAKRLLEPIRANADTPENDYRAASELLFQLATQANQPETALQTARETAEKSTGRDRTVWLTRLGNHFLQDKQPETASEYYGLALGIPELPDDSRNQLLPVQAQLLLGLGQAQPLFELLPELFRKNLPLKAETAEELARFCQEQRRADLANHALKRLLDDQLADESEKLRATIRLAELEAADN